MRTKSIVQERLDGGRNRMEILRREVESRRMSSADLNGGLRQVGGMLDGIHKFVSAEKKMKFQLPIKTKLEKGMTILERTIAGLEGNSLTNDAVNQELSLVMRNFDSIQELVDLEIEDLG